MADESLTKQICPVMRKLLLSLKMAVVKPCPIRLRVRKVRNRQGTAHRTQK